MPDLRPRLRPLDGVRGAADGDHPAALPAEAAGIEDAEALRIFRQAARLDPHDPDYHFILGLALHRAGRFADAAAACREAVQLLGREPDYHYALGASLWPLRRYLDAEAAFREAVRLRPDDVRALNGLACALIQLDRPREAIPVLEAALGADGRGGDLHGNLAIALWRIGESVAALRSLRTAVELAPTDAELYRTLGIVLSAMGRHHEAVDVFRLAARYRPEAAESHLDLAEALHATGRHAEAQSALDEALRLDPVAVAGRPASQEVSDALRLQRLRTSLASEAQPRAEPGRLLRWATGITAGRPGRRLVRPATVLPLLGLAALGYAATQVAPAYFTRYQLEDDMAEVARAPVRDDSDILERLMHVVRRRGLDALIEPSSFEIRTHPKYRQITCRYQVPVRVLPGIRQVLRFHIDVERPYFLAHDGSTP